MSNKTDLELIGEVRGGRKEAFEELVLRHDKFLMKVVTRMTRDLNLAEDIVQESFIKAYRRLNIFEGRSSFRSWLYQIALNTTRNRFRRSGRESLGVDHLDVAVDSEAESELMADDVRSVIQREVDLLPARQRQALSLRVFEDLSFKEIAALMGCPYDTAKANYRHAVMKLRARLGGDLFLRGWVGPAAGVSMMEMSASAMEVDG